MICGRRITRLRKNIFIFIRCISNSTNVNTKNGILFSLLSILVASLGSSIQYSGAQNILPVSSEPGKIETPNLPPSTKDENGEEPEVQGEEPEVQGEEPAVKSDGKPEVQGEEPADQENNVNDTVTTVPLKRPTGTDLGLKNLTVAPIEEGVAPIEEHGKLILGSCQRDFPTWSATYTNAYYPIRCNVPGASPGDNVVVSSTPITGSCGAVASSSIKEPNVVSIMLLKDPSSTGQTEGHDHGVTCEGEKIRGKVIFSIIVFRPTDLDIIRTLEELLKLNPNASKLSE